jgi:hypothetical protein
MITSIKKVSEGTYVLNDSLSISNFDFGDDGVSYDINFDDKLLTEDEAALICEEFIMKALTNLINEENNS